MSMQQFRDHDSILTFDTDQTQIRRRDALMVGLQIAGVELGSNITISKAEFVAFVDFLQQAVVSDAKYIQDNGTFKWTINIIHSLNMIVIVCSVLFLDQNITDDPNEDEGNIFIISRRGDKKKFKIWLQEMVDTKFKSPRLQKLYKKLIAGKVVDTAMGLRNSGLPSIAVENIASHAYDTTGFNLYQLMSMIKPITEDKRPGVMGAGQTEYDKQEYIDL